MDRKFSHVDDPSRVGARLRIARQNAGLTLRDLSFAGCSAAYLSHIERGRRTPSLQVLVELARRLGVDPHYLARGETSGSAEPRETSEIDLYRRTLAIARTREERVWVLAGLAQAAAVAGDPATARSALERALVLLPAGPAIR